MDGSLLLFFASILIVAGLLYAVIAITKRGAVQLDVDKYRRRWMEIEHKFDRNNAATYPMAVIFADKLVDAALREKGFKGETMGHRMKQATSTWSNVNAIWTAHKLRNKLAHEADAEVSYDEARRALSSFKQALKDLGAI